MMRRPAHLESAVVRARRRVGVVGLVALSACDGAVVTPPPEPRPNASLDNAFRATVGAPGGQMPPPPPAAASTGTTFVQATDSDAWVTATLKIQPTYARVLLVDPTGSAKKTVRVARLDLNARTASSDAMELPVARTVSTLQAAADAAEGGDLVAVMPGRYAGFVLGDKPSAGDGRYIHFKALGQPGEVTIASACPVDPNWMVYLKAAHHVVFEGFNIAGTSEPGKPEPKSPKAGIMIDGAFPETGKLAHHLVIAGNFSHNHRMWGLHSVDSHSVLLQGNLFALSGREHSAYVSDGSDDYVIRRNVFFGSRAGGLQCNLDPEASLVKIVGHPALRSLSPPEATREWADRVMKAATAQFGENGFPDGRGVNFLIEENVMNENGKRGGGALNLAGLQHSLVQNNLLYRNHANGIAQWDNENPYDAPRVSPGPSEIGAAKEPSLLPMWGCHDNVIRNNTVIMSHAGRPALQAIHGSYGMRSRNNVLMNDLGPSIEVDASSVLGTDASHDVFRLVDYGAMPVPLKSLAKSLPDGGGSIKDVSLERLRQEFVRYGEEPWVVIEGNWWRLNPSRPDFRPKPGAPTLVGRADPKELPPRDLLGNARKAPAVGALGP